MKKSTLKILILEICMIIVLSMNCFVFDIFSIKDYGYFAIILTFLFFTIALLGFARNKYNDKRQISVALLVFSALYQAFIFVLFGLKLGFVKSIYNLGINHLFKIVLPVILIIVSSEILRHQMLSKGRYSKLVIVFTTILFILIESFINIGMYNLNTPKGIFEFIFFAIFIFVIKNIFLTFMSYHFGYTPNIVYRIITEIPIYYLPIYPNMNDYLQAVINLILPFILLFYFIKYTLAHKRNKITKPDGEIKKFIKRVLSSLLMMTVISFFLLVNGVFKYFFLVVGSGSMEKELYVGDMVLVEKITNYDTLVEGQVLVFKKENKTIIHRIVDINRENDIISIKTKGDNNNSEDKWIVNDKDIIGIAKWKIPYIGYPTIWLNRLLGGK